MNILNGSFYHSYGNKKQLFIEALKSYEQDFKQKRTALFLAPQWNFKQKLRIMFTHIFDRQIESICPKGCFLFNSVSSEILHEVEIYKLVKSAIDSFENFLEREIQKAIKEGEIDQKVDPKTTASVLIVYIQGLMKLSVLAVPPFIRKLVT